MGRNREFNAHLAKYVSSCVRQGVSRDSIRGALQAIGGMSEASVELFLRTELKEFAMAGSGEINLGGLMVLGSHSSEDEAPEPEMSFPVEGDEPAGLAPPIEDVLPEPQPEPSFRPRRSSLEIILENQRQISEITNGSAPVQLERVEHARPVRFIEPNPMPRKHRRSGRVVQALRREAMSLLHSLYVYCLLFLLGGLVAIHVLDRVDPVTLTGTHLAQPSAMIHIGR